MGYVFSTGQAIALSDVLADPRFDQATARTHRLRAAVHRCRTAHRRRAPVGVLQVLDKRGSPSFSLRDMELLAVFARQATAAIEASKVQRDTDQTAPKRAGSSRRRRVLTDDQVDDLVAAATGGPRPR